MAGLFIASGYIKPSLNITLFQTITLSFKITSRTMKTVTDTSNSTFTITYASGGDDDDDDSLEVITPNGGESRKIRRCCQ
jgi:hypothetical protein